MFMPIANGASVSTIQQPYSELTCLHINHFNPGSRVAPAPAQPTPLYSNATTSASAKATGISGGAIAGIIIAVVAVLAIVAVGVWIFIRRKRKTQPARGSDAVEIYTEGRINEKRMAEVPGYSISELSPHSAKSELPAVSSAELHGDYHYELEGSHRLHELPGDSPREKTG